MAQGARDPQLLVGSLIRDAVPIRDPANKWHAPTYMFSDTVYPDYLSGMKLGQKHQKFKGVLLKKSFYLLYSGTGYLMSCSTAMALYTASLDTPLFHLEDIFVTGILASKVNIR